MFKIQLEKATRVPKLLNEFQDLKSAIQQANIYFDCIKKFGGYVLPYAVIRIRLNDKTVWQAGSY